MLWKALRGKQLNGIKIRRQQPIGPFVVDFYIPAYRLVIEVDGPIHETQQEADQARQELLEQLGLKFVRLRSQLVENNMKAAILQIQEATLSPFSPCGRRGSGG